MLRHASWLLALLLLAPAKRGSAQVAPEPAPGLLARGTVLAAESRQPLVFARVWVSGTEHCRGTAIAGGQFALSCEGGPRVCAHFPDYEIQCRPVSRGANAAPLEFVLSRSSGAPPVPDSGFVAEGFVRAAGSGTPLLHARVWVAGTDRCRVDSTGDGSFGISCDRGAELCAHVPTYAIQCHSTKRSRAELRALEFLLVREVAQEADRERGSVRVF